MPKFNDVYRSAYKIVNGDKPSNANVYGASLSEKLQVMKKAMYLAELAAKELNASTNEGESLIDIAENRQRELATEIATSTLELGRKQKRLLRILAQSGEELPKDINDVRQEIDAITDTIVQRRIELDELKSYGDLQDIFAWRQDGGPWHISKVE